MFVREDPRARDADGSVDLWLVRTDGGEARRLVGFAEPVWSPDGRRIAVVRQGTKREAGIFLLRARGDRARRLTRGLDDDPAWSPDGRRLAFRRGLQLGDVYVVDVDGRRLRNLTRTQRLDEREPDWRPD